LVKACVGWNIRRCWKGRTLFDFRAHFPIEIFLFLPALSQIFVYKFTVVLQIGENAVCQANTNFGKDILRPPHDFKDLIISANHSNSHMESEPFCFPAPYSGSGTVILSAANRRTKRGPSEKEENKSRIFFAYPFCESNLANMQAI